ncbi:glycoside hydrolase family 28 protein [Collybiopsis luxurians FD-317 M1]|uniref:endo-polygalacturonase n=1 Tax=Collybiopsis luxurians FD-317 M1 TaxID=944289 RepID=A0A0D0CHK5_9AGAR|nr:glycoside hydrolase family 28 protein [Collybiopsis luxurians FD-317 M1]
MQSLLAFATLAILSSGSLASPTNGTTPTSTAKRATCTVDSVASSTDLTDCTSIIIPAWTVPAGETVTIKAASGASIEMTGSVTFSQTTASGPLWTFDTDDASLNGNGFSFKGNGPLYWDGEGTNGGVAKPHPFIKFQGSGTFTNFIIKDSPAQAISVGTTATSSFTDVLVDNSDGAALGANTDGFDVSASDLTISGCTVLNQDDCVAINSGSNIVFENNVCTGGHGISIGSIATGKSVSGVTISGNTVSESMYGMRIKVDSDATDASVSDITYIGNKISANDKYGYLITQSYSEDFGTPGTGSTVSGITFSGATTTVTTTGNFPRVGVDCGHCTGTWNWGSIDATGGEASDIVLTGGATIEGGTF